MDWRQLRLIGLTLYPLLVPCMPLWLVRLIGCLRALLNGVNRALH